MLKYIYTYNNNYIYFFVGEDSCTRQLICLRIERESVDCNCNRMKT